MGNKLLPLRPFLDPDGLLRVGGRLGLSELPYTKRHPVVLPGKHQLTKLIIRNEHTRLLHAGPVSVMASLSQRFHVIGARRAVRAITRNCVACRRIAGKPHPQLMGQLPRERLDPGIEALVVAFALCKILKELPAIERRPRVTHWWKPRWPSHGPCFTERAT